MFGFLFGTACLVGLVYMLTCGPRDTWGYGTGRGRRGRGRGPVPFMLDRLFERLDTTPGQEKVIRSTVDELVDRAHAARSELKGTRKDLAQAFRGEVLDETQLGELLARNEETFRSVQQELVGAIAKVHEVLDERQRKQLSHIIEHGPGRGWRFASHRHHGPYRCAPAEEAG